MKKCYILSEVYHGGILKELCITTYFEEPNYSVDVTATWKDVLPHTPYSPDVVSSNYHLLQSLQNT